MDNFLKLLSIYDYKHYTSFVTTPEMACSFECISFMIKFLHESEDNFKNVLDMGSGFSSFALRKYNNDFNKNMNIVSVDTDEEWLSKTKAFIGSNGLSMEGLFTMKEFVENNNREKFDFIFYDLGYYQDGSRQRFIPFLINEIVDKESIILFDDMHSTHYFMFLMDYLSSTCDFAMYNTKLDTQDRFGRFAMMFSGVDPVKRG